MSPVSSFALVLNASEDQFARLTKLQAAFALVCNDLSPFVSEHQCWNRVTLHHLKYRDMRDRYPEMGSQMVCNAIYAVSKVSRLVYQHPASPYHVKKMAGQKLPVIRFAPECPVYFDSHTLTLNDQKLSMYTMDGRIKFELTLTEAQKTLLSNHKLIEITLSKNIEGKFMLTFHFGKSEAQANALVLSAASTQQSEAPQHTWPTYVGVEGAA